MLALRNIYEQMWLDVLDEAKAAGLIRGNISLTRRFLTGALSWTTTWFKPQGSLSLDQIAEQAMLLLLKDG
ncbi:hypothetical protein D3C87_2163580 [compost metagenome]